MPRPVTISRSAIPLVRLAAAFSAFAAAFWLAGTAVADGRAAVTPLAPRTAVSQFVDVPSHANAFRATLTPLRPVRVGDRVDGIVEIRTAGGEAVADAQLLVRGTMPESGRVVRDPPEVTRTAAPGRYRVSGLQLDQPGWWNIAVTIRTPFGTDSLAFNILLPEE